MAREHARISCSIWRPGDDFRDRSPDAQRLYFVLLSQRELNNAGVMPLMVNKWSRLSAGTTADDIEKALGELEQHRYVVVDRDTEEVLVRTFIRNDGVAKQPNVLKNALRLALQIESETLRSALARELVRLDHPHATETAFELDPEAIPPSPPDPGPNPSGNPSPNSSPAPERNPSHRAETNPSPRSAGWGRGRGRGKASVLENSRGDARDPRPPLNPDPDNPRCRDHRGIPATERGPDCRACAAVRRQIDAQLDAQPAAELTARRAAIDACPDCDDRGLVERDNGALARCKHPATAVAS